MNEPHRERPSSLSWKAMIVWLALIAAVLGAWIFYRLETLPSRTARQVRDGFADVLGLKPVVKIQERVIFEQSQPLMELAVITRETQVERESEVAWLGSKKRLKLRGVFRIKAGFDLAQPFTVQIEGHHVSAQLPEPRILSVDPIDVEVLSMENGIWNKISPADVAAEMRALPILAREKAIQAGVQKEAWAMVKKQLQERLGKDFELEVHGPPNGAAGGF